MSEKRESYKVPILAGLGIMAFFIAFYEFNPIGGEGGRLLEGTLSVILRIATCYWVSDLTKRQGRNPIGYVILAVFIPAITLIFVGMNGDSRQKFDSMMD